MNKSKLINTILITALVLAWLFWANQSWQDYLKLKEKNLWHAAVDNCLNLATSEAGFNRDFYLACMAEKGYQSGIGYSSAKPEESLEEAGK